jgi:DnaJ-class molecular chaperone
LLDLPNTCEECGGTGFKTVDTKTVDIGMYETAYLDIQLQQECSKCKGKKVLEPSA